MAITSTFKTPTMMIDGVATPVNRTQWAKIKLSPEDFARFAAAEQREENYWKEAEAAGEVERTPIYEVRDGRRYQTGSVTTFHNGFGVASDAEYAEFFQQYLDDPDLTWPN